MNKLDFNNILSKRLKRIPKEDRDKTIEYYNEIIDDRIEDGISEEDAIKQLGSIDDIVANIINGIPLHKIVKERVKSSRRITPLEITLIIIGFPLWFTLLISLFAVILSLYVSILAVVISLFAVTLSLFASSILVLLSSVYYFIVGNFAIGIFGIGATLLLIGLGIFFCYLSKYGAKACWFLLKKIVLLIKLSFVNRSEK